METSDLLQILIPSLISLIGFPLTYFFTKRQIKSEHRMELALRTNEIKRELYQKQCSLINEVIADSDVVYSDEYIQKLQELKPDVYLFASNEIKDDYKQFATNVFFEKEDYESTGIKAGRLGDTKEFLNQLIEKMRKDIDI